MILPGLREELGVREGPRAHDGQPNWTLHDPSRNRFFRLDWLTFEILQRWSLGDPRVIARQVAEQTPIKASIDDVMAVLTFAGTNQLLKIAGPDTSSSLVSARERLSHSWWKQVLHNYLFFRIPLFRPDNLLQRLLRPFAFVFSRPFWWLTLAAMVTGIFLMSRQWTAARVTWGELFSLHGVFGYAVVLCLVKIIHEFGHGLAAVRFGCRVPSMGMAFLVLTPVAYTDVNEAWTLKERRPRILIGAAGVLAELALAAWATLAWGLMPDGFLRNAVFMVATVTWLKSLVVNTSPLMRFDGYYILSDWLDLPNLHSRSFSLARWQMREWLFALREAPPEHFSPRLRRGLIGLAFFIWIYRLVVFLGIAVFVYHYFFKALGIVLFCVEIAWFVALPIASEMKAWTKRRQAILRSPRTGLSLIALALLIGLAAFPFPQRLRVLGQLAPENEYQVIAPEAGKLAVFDLPDGIQIDRGQKLAEIVSPSLKLRRAKAQARRDALKLELTAVEGNAALRARAELLREQLATAEAAFREAEADFAKLTPTAPLPGIWKLHDFDLREGDEISRHELLGTIVPHQDWRVVAYLGEHDLHLISEGTRAKILLEGSLRKIELTVEKIEQDASRVIAQPLLSADHGGDVKVAAVGNDLVPTQSVYRVIFRTGQLPPELGPQLRRGTVTVFGRSESFLARWSRNALSLLWRELGF